MADSRKQVEIHLYDELYRHNKANADQSIRRSFLSESDDAFNALIDQHALPGTQVLEIGCGDGKHTILAAQHGASVIASDMSLEGLRLAKENIALASVEDQVRFMQLDAEVLQLPSESVDMVINHEVFSSVDIQKALPEIQRVLRPGGILIGKETLGHNPLFNLNRSIGVWRGSRTQWAADHIFKQNDLLQMKQLFDSVNAQYFHCFAVLFAPLVKRLGASLQQPIGDCLRRWDHKLLRKASNERYAFKVVFEAINKRGG